MRSVSISHHGPFAGDSGDHISIDAPPAHPPEEMSARWTQIGPDFFETLSIPLLRGRTIRAEDARRGARVCVVNEPFVKYFFPEADPIGRHITDEYPTTRETFEIIGVVADSREHNLQGKIQPRFYSNFSHPIGDLRGVTFLLRASPHAAGIAAAIRQAVAKIDGSLEIERIRTVNEQIESRLLVPRMIAQLSTFFGAAALLLAAIGLYGLMAYTVSRRTSEIGLRMALGASGGNVVWMVVREILWLVGAGVAIGLPCAWALGRLVRNNLFGITPADAATIAVAIAGILLVTLLAGFLPARRASRIDPVHALRCE